jgi:hypothetical protein
MKNPRNFLLRLTLPQASLLTSLLLLLVGGCERAVPDGLLTKNPASLVINAFISPQDSLIQVFVYESIPVNTALTTPRLVPNATVRLSSGSESVILPKVRYETSTPSSFEVYQIPAVSFPIQAGKTYTLHVSTPDGRQVEGRCTVPAPNSTLLVRPVPSDSGKVRLLYSWQDPVGVGHYYRPAGETEFTSYLTGSNTFLSGEEGLGQRVYWEEGIRLLSDSRFDGEVLSAVTSPFLIPPASFSKITIRAYLLTTDEAYFRYHSTLNQQRKSRADDPFAEPVPIYSNLTGGVGVFAAYNRTEVRITLN